MTKDHIVTMGVCMPKSLKEKIDKERGDIPRSKYISRILKQQISRQEEHKNEDNAMDLEVESTDPAQQSSTISHVLEMNIRD